jgi:hypothetical protein
VQKLTEFLSIFTIDIQQLTNNISNKVSRLIFLGSPGRFSTRLCCFRGSLAGQKQTPCSVPVTGQGVGLHGPGRVGRMT